MTESDSREDRGRTGRRRPRGSSWRASRSSCCSTPPACCRGPSGSTPSPCGRCSSCRPASRSPSRSRRAPWLLLLGPALVLGSLAWLASGNRPQAPVGPWEAATVGPPRGARSGVDLEAALAGARLRLAVADDVPAGRLVDGRSLSRSESDAPRRRTRERGTAQVRLDGGKATAWSSCPAPASSWELRLPAELPLDAPDQGRRAWAASSTSPPGRRSRFRTEGVFIGVAAAFPRRARRPRSG